LWRRSAIVGSLTPTDDWPPLTIFLPQLQAVTLYIDPDGLQLHTTTALIRVFTRRPPKRFHLVRTTGDEKSYAGNFELDMKQLIVELEKFAVVEVLR
jgi:hypothetical protein